jgi:hypothetical protein
LLKTLGYPQYLHKVIHTLWELTSVLSAVEVLKYLNWRLIIE